MLALKLSMLELSSVFGLIVQGLRSNCFGLACPFYCAQPSLGSPCACFLVGLVCGFGLCAWLVFRFDFVPVPASTVPGPATNPHPSPSAPVGRACSALLGPTTATLKLLLICLVCAFLSSGLRPKLRTSCSLCQPTPVVKAARRALLLVSLSCCLRPLLHLLPHLAPWT